jgi:hypothetical protein
VSGLISQELSISIRKRPLCDLDNIDLVSEMGAFLLPTIVSSRQFDSNT